MRRMHLLAPAISAAVFLAAAPATLAAQELRGFSAAAAKTERDWEARLRALPDTARLRAAMQRLTAHAHHVGSPADRQNAEWIRDQYTSFGWDAHIETFGVLFPTPTSRVVELIAPTRFTAVLQEPTVPEDPTSAQREEQLPTYNVYSVDGDVTGPLVFANYGTQADYDELARRGVSVKGAIVLVKYGRNFRGMKPKIAAEHGAVGCLIYSDPGDDGYAGGDVFPKGPMRPAQGVQRGSVEDLASYPGDPLTPAVASTAAATRLAVKSAPTTTITRIPVQPISYGDAQPLLAALGGPLAPPAWRGGLPITYRLGPGEARVHVALRFDWATKPLYDVIARLPGTTEAEQWVIRGNHHDAWTYGAADPISALVAQLEEARALGQLYRQGWRPKRTIVHAAWDGEEPGLLGSTEWVEAHAAELAEHAVAYLNTDSNGRGFFGMGGSHTLEHFINEVAKDIPDPEAHVSAWRRSLAAADAAGRTDARSGDDLRIGALGSGSDYSAFLQHLGIASLNVGFGGEDEEGIYHSIYDDFYWYTHFSDTSFAYGRALAQAGGTAVMRLADADVLPFAFTNLAATTQRYVQELQTLRDTRSKQIAERKRQVEDSTFAIANDPRHPMQPPVVEAAPPHFDFAPLLNAQDSLAAAADRFEKSYAAWSKRPATRTDGATLRQVNERLAQAERALLAPEGLRGRPWYRHLLYAPGFYEGYGAKTMPGVREAIERGRWSEVNPEIARVGEALRREATVVNEAAELLEGAPPSQALKAAPR